jgi:hypothetical protein
MRRPSKYRRLVLAVFRAKGPELTDAELAWYIRVALASNPSSAKKVRHQLANEGILQFARKVRITDKGRLQKIWELKPQYRKSNCKLQFAK